MVSQRNPWDGSEETLRILVLQAHQISGQLNPRIPLRSLVQSQSVAEAHAPGETNEARFGKLGTLELGRLVNERLAPGGLN